MRTFLRISAVVLALNMLCGFVQSAPPDAPWPMQARDPVKLELVMQLVVTCSEPEAIGGGEASKDGKRTEVWPIIGGRFEGKGIRGAVVPGGGDFPVLRPDGIEVVDALYRLKTDDGVTIVIHNKGLGDPKAQSEHDWHYRLAPEFFAPEGKYDWLNRHLFVSTLSEVPPGMQQAKGPKQNDRLIQIYQVQ